MTADANDPHKKPGIAFWSCVTIVSAIVAYPLSFIALIWLDRWGHVPEWSYEILRSVYAPMMWIIERLAKI